MLKYKTWLKIKKIVLIFFGIKKPDKIDLKYRTVKGKKHNVETDVYINDVFSHTVNVFCIKSINK
jgi:hypothetical protein